MSATTNNNSSVMKRCISLAEDGDLSPDLRVNYTFGLVLGEQEFRQEQLYFLNKDYLHNRALHGYGTVSGLNVKVEAETETENSDIKITVDEGIGIDQIGRTFIVNDAHCARLGEWIKKQSPDVFDHQSGNTKRVFVVATYDECKDKLVPIAGKPCSTSEQNKAASRIRDSVNITLSDKAPAMPAWYAIQRFAWLMSQVRVVRRLPQPLSSENDILELLKLIKRPAQFALRYTEITHDVSEDNGGQGDFKPLQLPAADINKTLDRIFTFWTTDIRPKLGPDLINPHKEQNVETGILLATIDFTYDNGNQPSNIQLDTTLPLDRNRPYLLSTQTIQQLMILGGALDTTVALEFATLNVANARNVFVWIHHPEALELPNQLGEGLKLLVNEREVNGSVGQLGNLTNVFRIHTSTDIPASARVELHFNLSMIHLAPDTDETPAVVGRDIRPLHVVSDFADLISDLRPTAAIPVNTILDSSRFFDTTEPVAEEIPISRVRNIRNAATAERNITLLEAIETYRFNYVGRENKWIRVYTFADNIAHLEDFATIQTSTGESDELVLLLWLHLTGKIEINSDAITVARLQEGTYVDLNASLSRLSNDVEQLYVITTEETLNANDLLRIQFDARDVTVRSKRLRQRIFDEQLAYHGFDGHHTLTLYHVIEPLAEEGSDINVDELIATIIKRVRAEIQEQFDGLRTLPFVSIATGFDENRQPGAELWFHIDMAPFEYEATIENISLIIGIEDNSPLTLIPFQIVQMRQNVVRVIFDLEEIDFDDLQALLAESPYLRFIFSLDDTIITLQRDNHLSLGDFMAAHNIKFDGHYLEDNDMGRVLVVYARWQFRLAGVDPIP